MRKNNLKLFLSLILLAGVSFFTCENSIIEKWWEPGTENKLYTVKFETNGGSPIPGEQHILHGERIAKLQPLSKDGVPAVLQPGLTFYGYGFAGWYKDINCTPGNEWDLDKDIVNSNLTLYAFWEEWYMETLYTVEFRTNGGNPDIAIMYLPTGSKVPEPPALRRAVATGTEIWCGFGGWFKDSACTAGNEWNFANDTVGTSGIILYAKWVNPLDTDPPPPPQYQVIFEPNGGSPVPRIQDLVSGTKAIEPYAMSRPGYAFGGWYRDAAFTQQWNFALDTVTENITLFARWVTNYYTIKFDADGGLPAPPNQSVTYGSRITKPPIMRKTGQGFVGWYADTNRTQLWDFDTPVIGDITLYAKWEDAHYIVRFDLKPYPFSNSGGSGHGLTAPSDQDIAEGGKVTEPPAPSNRAGWAFVGWYYYDNSDNSAPPSTDPADAPWDQASQNKLIPWDFDTTAVTNALLDFMTQSPPAPPVLTLYARWARTDISDLVWVRKGKFEMGAAGSGTSPARNVRITEGFYMSKYQVQQGVTTESTLPLSQQEYLAVMNKPSNHTFPNASNTYINANPSQFQANQRTRPVERVSWYDAVYFCNLLSIDQGLTPVYTISNIDRAGVLGIPQPTTTIQYAIANADVAVNWSANGYRLPTEAEWEYAARGGDGSPGDFIYAGSNTADDVAWFNTNSGSMTHPVGTKAPNGLGIYDMNGNLMEWCWDWYGSQYYKEQLNSASYGANNNTDIDPKGPAAGTERVRRGGSWNNAVNNVRSVYREKAAPGNANWTIGFRVVRYPKPEELY